MPVNRVIEAQGIYIYILLGSDSMQPSIHDEAEISSVQLDIPSAGDRLSTQEIEIQDSTSINGSSYYKHSQLRPPRQVISGDKLAKPEKRIMVFALRLALLEKAASALGALGFIWATVVLLGGFAIKLGRADFWFVTIILLTESTRIFSRSHELEWQHHTTADLKKDAKRASFRVYNAGRSFLNGIFRPFCADKVRDGGRRAELKRSWSSSEVKLVPYTGWLSVSENVGRLLFWLQLLSASTCVGLSVWRLAGQNYGVDSGSDITNRKSALNVFYGLSATEALLFLVEKGYWQWKVRGQKLLDEVNEEYGFDSGEVATVRRFFYDAYSRCVNGSVFDVLKMDLVSFSVELLKSSSAHGQLTGARVLSAFVNDGRFAEETLRSIGIMQDVVERLVEMLNWKNRHEQHIRKAAAEIVYNLVKKNRNSLRVAWIPGALDSIASLLYDAKVHKEVERCYDYSGFSLIGLRILKNLAKDHTNCAKIGSTKDLLPKIIVFTEVDANFSNARIRTAKLSLQLLKMLASSKGVTGKELRKEILKNVFTTSNLRDVLLFTGFDHLRLQILAVESLTGLVLDEEGRESVGSTGGVLTNLFSLFFMERFNSDEEMNQVVCKAGEALTLLSLDNNHNCQSMIQLKLSRHVIRDLIAVMKDTVQGVHAVRILRNLCAYADAPYDELSQIAIAAAQVLKFVMEEQGTFQFQEATIGLIAQMFKLMDKSEIDLAFKEVEITKRLFMMRLIEVLRRHSRPSIKIPNIRRFCIELVIYMLEKEKQNFYMKRLELEEALEQVIESTSEIESYNTFSGSIGLTKHHTTIHSITRTAIKLLCD
ncbi:hypothetical protein KI387_017084 [Taxus chinensis]|uniref:Uncharacterized protein n=1 Tax=Taxus chinensis TaxID=29808 RepID=A0AA38LHB4_TAXCH|nr:hypothetical protein KI387_017084 [Taxus chinensis]